MREAVGWLLRVTRPVLSPLGLSVLFRHVERLAGLGLLAVGAGAVARLVAPAGGESAVVAGWLPHTTTGLLVALVMLALVKGVSRYLEQFFAHLVAFTALELLRVEVYRALVPQAPMVMQTSTSGDLMVRATKDVDRIEVFFAHTFPPAITAVTIPLIGVGAVGAAVSWPVAGLLAVGLLLSGLAIPWLGASRSLAAAGRAAERRGRLGQHLTDSLQGIAEVTGYGHATRRLDEMAALDAQIAADEAPRVRVQALRAGLQTAIMAGTTLAVALAGLAAGLDVVSLAVTVAVAWKLFDSTAPVSEFMASLDASLAAARRVHQVVIAPPAVSDADQPQVLPAGPLSVSWRGVDYRYPGAGFAREAALDDVTIEVPAGSHCSLVGVSGSGKSTLMGLALRVDDPSGGAVLVGGVDASRVRLDELRSRLALVSQQTFLMPGSIAENLRLAAPEADEAQLWEALRVAHLDAEVRAMPDALATVVGEHGQRLSGGQRQRLALARALLGPAEVFLLDEFTAHLDPALAARVRSSLRAARPGATIIESTHDLDRLADADQVVALDRGRIAPELLERLREG